MVFPNTALSSSSKKSSNELAAFFRCSLLNSMYGSSHADCELYGGAEPVWGRCVRISGRAGLDRCVLECAYVRACVRACVSDRSRQETTMGGIVRHNFI